MNPKTVGSGWILALILWIPQQGLPKPLTRDQPGSKWTEVEPERPLGSEKSEPEETLSMRATDPEQWVTLLSLKHPLEEAPLSETTLQRLLGTSSRRSKTKTRKAPSQGCFGVKLDRIGALSGLGC